jgi:hypothetical protein
MCELNYKKNMNDNIRNVEIFIPSTIDGAISTMIGEDKNTQTIVFKTKEDKIPEYLEYIGDEFTKELDIDLTEKNILKSMLSYHFDTNIDEYERSKIKIILNGNIKYRIKLPPTCPKYSRKKSYTTILTTMIQKIGEEETSINNKIALEYIISDKAIRIIVGK